jgi:NADPH:quinone reductase-like Zn-dependent oxidoreductase
MKTATQDRPSGETATMQAIVQDPYGEAGDMLRLEETGRPAVGDGEVLLRVHAAGVDRGVWHLMTGLPYPVRLAGYGVRAPKTRVRGREVAGRVEAIVKDVTTFQVGDEVFGIAEGAFAGYACAQPGKLAHRPESLTVVQAAAVSVSALTAEQRAGGRMPSGIGGRGSTALRQMSAARGIRSVLVIGIAGRGRER